MFGQGHNLLMYDLIANRKILFPNKGTYWGTEGLDVNIQHFREHNSTHEKIQWKPADVRWKLYFKFQVRLGDVQWVIALMCKSKDPGLSPKSPRKWQIRRMNAYSLIASYKDMGSREENP